MSEPRQSAIVLHLPHDSTVIPDGVRGQFLLDDQNLWRELVRMTDHRTRELFAPIGEDLAVVAAPVSRLVVDVERFESDEQEPMSACGMGVVYTKAADGTPLRRPLQRGERGGLLDAYYRPHHRRLENAVTSALQSHGHCLIVDGHSFPSIPLPYEFDQSRDRPDICIGTDPFHTPPLVLNAFVQAFQEIGFNVAVNRPFAGAIVPLEHYGRTQKVVSVMVEVNRSLYLDEASATPLRSFIELAETVQTAWRSAGNKVMSAWIS